MVMISSQGAYGRVQGFSQPAYVKACTLSRTCFLPSRRSRFSKGRSSMTVKVVQMIIDQVSKLAIKSYNQPVLKISHKNLYPGSTRRSH